MTIVYNIKSKSLKTFWKYKESTTVCNYAFKYMDILKEENSNIMKKYEKMKKVRSNYNWNHFLLSLWALSLYAIQGKQIKLGHINAVCSFYSSTQSHMMILITQMLIDILKWSVFSKYIYLHSCTDAHYSYLFVSYL